MNKISIHKTFRNSLLSAVLGLASMNLFSHTALESSVPAADAHLNEVPAELRLTFGAAVNLMEVAVVNPVVCQHL